MDEVQLDGVIEAVKRLAAAITPNIAGGKDAMGGHVECLTEAVMGITKGLEYIGDALNRIADNQNSG